MSGTQTDVDDRSAADEPARVDPETERVARANGWRPKEEFRGDVEKWVPADVFIARGIEVPAILANRNKMLAQQVDELRTRFEETSRQNDAKLEDAVGTVRTMTTMLRSSEQRAYDRARRELREDMEKAVEAGDTATWKRLDQQREDLDKERPAAAPVVPDSKTTPPAPPHTPPGPTDPAVQRFFAENRWYDPERKRTDRDDEMMAYADTIHNGLRSTRGELTMEQNLRIVEAEVRNRFPDRFNRARREPDNDADDPPARAPARNDPPANDRRDDPPSVMPSGRGTAPRRAAGRFTFDTMPQESKTQYDRYAKMLQGKGDPLTKEEWARDYWAQYQDDGAP